MRARLRLACRLLRLERAAKLVELLRVEQFLCLEALLEALVGLCERHQLLISHVDLCLEVTHPGP